MLRNTLTTALLVLPAAGFAATVITMSSAAPPAARYVDAIDWPAKDAGLARLALSEEMLALSFERICTDTFCEGEYQNLRPMQLACSVDAAKGTLKQCLWMFSGSKTSMNPKTGAVQSAAKVFKCKLALGKDTPVDAFYDAMHGAELLDVKLPMTNRTVNDSLLGCLP
jgi:hypothetical protein